MDRPKYICISKRWVRHKHFLEYHASDDGQTTLCGQAIKGQVVIETPDNRKRIRCEACRRAMMQERYSDSDPVEA